MKKIVPPFMNIYENGMSFLKSFPTPGYEQTPSGILYKPTDLIFSPDQPSCLWPDEEGKPYRGQAAVKRRIEDYIMALQPDERLKCLFTGPAGLGKTTLAWIMAQLIRTMRLMQGYESSRFFEILPSQFENKKAFDPFILQLEPGDIVFIDEVHVLAKTVGAEPLYNTLADTGRPRYPLGNGEGWLDIDPSICWITASTEPGDLDGTNGGALRRRLEPELRLEPPTYDDLVDILGDQDFPIHVDAKMDIALRSGKLPWQLLLIYKECRVKARVANSPEITLPHALRAFEDMGLDKNGLLPQDRSVIKALLQVNNGRGRKLGDGTVVYMMAEPQLLASAGVDKQTYKTLIQPKLSMLGFLMVRQGQCLTEEAVAEYQYLLKEDT